MIHMCSEKNTCGCVPIHIIKKIPIPIIKNAIVNLQLRIVNILLYCGALSDSDNRKNNMTKNDVNHILG